MIFPGSCTARGARHRASLADSPWSSPETRRTRVSSRPPASDTTPDPPAVTVIFGRREVLFT